MGFRSNEEFIFFEMEDNSLNFRVAELSGRESISALYDFDLEVLSEDVVEYDDVIGKGCVITIQNNNHVEEDGAFGDSLIHDRFIHGIVNSFECIAEGEKFSTYKAKVVPRIWPLKQRINSRIFQEQTVQDIVETILSELGLSSDEYSWECQNSYSPIEYCVQYQESEFAFISRLLEEEGIFYLFTHEADKHKLIFKDDSSSCELLDLDDPISYISDAKGMVTNQHVHEFLTRKSLTPGKVTFKDYNFTKPTLKLQSEKQGDENTDREVFVYGNFSEKARGEHLAKIRLESINTFKEMGVGGGNVNKFTPGFVLDLEDKRRGNYTGKYLLTSVIHLASQAQAYEQYASTKASHYSNSFECIPSSVSYRAPIDTQKPLVKGTQTAIVCGPKGEEIYTDPDGHGRVKVQFHWDRYGKADEFSSCWIRVSQMWAGQGYGGFSLPRIGQEVIVDYVDGDPDHPIIVGRVHHGDNRSPYKLPDKKTVSTLKTNSSKGGEGFNELRFEDEKGKEQIFVHAERNKDVRIKNDSFENVGHDSHLKVLNDRFAEIENNEHLVVNNDIMTQVKGDVHNTYDADVNQITKGSESYTVKGDRKSLVKGSDNAKASMDIKLEAGMNYGLKAGQSTDIKSGMTINLQAGMTINLKAGSSFISIGPAGVQISGPMVMINSGGSASPANPPAPAKPSSVTAPDSAKDADTAEAGKVEKTKDMSMPITPSEYGPQAQAMKYAAQSGTPFCEQCNEGKS